MVKCDCGVEFSVLQQSLLSGNTKSCGCFKRDRLVETQTKHGLSKSPEMFVWAAMIQRCNNKRSTNYNDYGGRGIKVCDRWMVFQNFIDDMGKRPSNKHEIDRIDNNLGYSPDNCRWSTRSDQVRNTRSNVWITHNGKTLCATDMAAECGININTLKKRLRSGWSVARALES
jgi:hypothetical protein